MQMPIVLENSPPVIANYEMTSLGGEVVREKLQKKSAFVPKKAAYSRFVINFTIWLVVDDSQLHAFVLLSFFK
jgi:hypothetical protein